jgi:CO/xanthine dehydrogenase Mo-binding subunit
VVSADVALGRGGFADDGAPRDALVAVPLPPDVDAVEAVEAGGLRWVVGESLLEVRDPAAKVQGRRSTAEAVAPIPLPPLPPGGVRLATGWVEPAYLEPDASWCEPGGEPASPLANGGAFGGKVTSPVTVAARELAESHGRAVRVLFSREDVVRLGPKRPPISASARLVGRTLEVVGEFVGRAGPAEGPTPYTFVEEHSWTPVAAPGPPVSWAPRAAGLAERTVLREGAIDAAGLERVDLVDERAVPVLLDAVAIHPGGARAGARVRIDPASGALEHVAIRVAAGDPLDAAVLRSYAIGAAHMALGWVLTEGLAVDPGSGEVHDLTIRSFGIVRAKDVPPIEVEIIDEPGPPLARSADAVFAAVAASTWNALSRAEGARPERFPARGTRAARMLRR